jgi:hypothetical protein
LAVENLDLVLEDRTESFRVAFDPVGCVAFVDLDKESVHAVLLDGAD